MYVRLRRAAYGIAPSSFNRRPVAGDLRPAGPPDRAAVPAVPGMPNSAGTKVADSANALPAVIELPSSRSPPNSIVSVDPVTLALDTPITRVTGRSTIPEVSWSGDLLVTV